MAPTFSIIIPCFHSAATLDACLESLHRQSFSDWEAIVIDSTPGDPSCADIANRHPQTCGHHHPQPLGAHAARNLAAQSAAGHFLAFIDPDMTADPDWLQTLHRAFHSGSATVAGGGVDCPPGYWSRAVHLTKYGWWLSGGRPAIRPQLPSGNFSLPRDLFLELGGFPGRFWEGDTELSYTLRARRLDLWHLPDARTVHYDAPPLRHFLRERWLRGIDTVKARSARLCWSLPHRLVRIAAAPAIWAVMMARSARFAFKSRWGLRWLLASPVIALGLASWVAGESRALAASPSE